MEEGAFIKRCGHRTPCAVLVGPASMQHHLALATSPRPRLILKVESSLQSGGGVVLKIGQQISVAVNVIGFVGVEPR